jgi:hypothetical protein
MCIGASGGVLFKTCWTEVFFLLCLCQMARALIGTCFNRHVLWLVRALIGTCSDWCGLCVARALIGSVWRVFWLVGALNDACSDGVLTRLLWHNVQHFRPHVHVHVVINARQVKMKAWQQVGALSKWLSKWRPGNRRTHCQNQVMTTSITDACQILITDNKVRTVKIKAWQQAGAQ